MYKFFVHGHLGELHPWTVDDSENLKSNLKLLKVTLSQHLLIFCQYLTSGDTLGATHPSLVDIACAL